jgi:colanic acid/amylovoran biosynthesis protein
MRILVYGVNSKNKGAQLLLAAAASKLRSWGHEPVVSARDVTPGSRREFGAVGLFSVERFGPLRSAGLDLLPRALSNRLPIVGDGHFDYVLDASGFSLTDAWGMAPVTSRLGRLGRWAGRGIGFTMLPQAFGPFTRPDVAEGVKRIADYADRVWARDETSYEHINALGTSAPVAIAPDITIGFAAPRISDEARGRILIVPNWNLAQRSGEGGREAYIASLSTVVRALREDGRDVVGMSHEGQQDLDLIEEVASRVGGMPVVNPRSGVACKSIIAGSELVIAGRYHALVSALSSGVPAIGHSWSHKYAALMRDFAVEDGLANPSIAAETIERVRALDLGAERARLRSVHDAVSGRVNEVWDQVSSALSHA